MYTLYDYIVDAVQARTDDECWTWPAQHVGAGYARVRCEGRNKKVHRVAYELRYGSVPDGLELDHTCMNVWCWNPDHVEPVTHQENCVRTVHPQSLRTHCLQGHPYDSENTYYTNGHRQCRTCNRDRKRKSYQLERRAQ